MAEELDRRRLGKRTERVLALAAMRSGSRLVTSTRRLRAASSEHRRASRCRRRPPARSCRADRSVAVTEMRASSPSTPSAWAIVGSTSAGSRTGDRSTNQTPSGNRSDASAATASANRVFRFLPGPDASRAARRRAESRARRRALSRGRRAGSPGSGRFVLVEALQRREVAARRAGRRAREPPRSLNRCSPRSRSVACRRARGRGRDEDLPAVPGGGDACRPVDVAADVALLGEERRSRCAARRAPGSARGERLGEPRTPRRARRARSGRRRRRRRPGCRPRRRPRRHKPRGSPPVLGERLRVRSAPSSCSSRVEPSTSVKRKVTVPVGRSGRHRCLRIMKRWRPHVQNRVLGKPRFD